MNIRARITAVGQSTGRSDKRGNPIRKVFCEGCEEEIYSDQDLSDVEYVKTKRGTDLFIHKECVEKVWRKNEQSRKKKTAKNSY